MFSFRSSALNNKLGNMFVTKFRHIQQEQTLFFKYSWKLFVTTIFLNCLLLFSVNKRTFQWENFIICLLGDLVMLYLNQNVNYYFNLIQIWFYCPKNKKELKYYRIINVTLRLLNRIPSLDTTQISNENLFLNN